MSQKPQLPPIPNESKIKQALGLGIGIWDYFDKQEKELGDTYTLTFPGQGPMVWTSDRDMIIDVIKLKREQIDGSLVQIPFDLGEENLLFSNDEAHHESRKLLIPEFAGNRLKVRAEMMGEIVREHIDSWKVGDKFDFPRLVGEITMDITCATLFDLREGEKKDLYAELMLSWILEANSDVNFTLASMVGARRFRNFLNRKYKRNLAAGKLGNAKKGIMPWKRSVDLKVQLASLLKQDIIEARERDDPSEIHTLSLLARTKTADGEYLPMEKVISEVYGLMIGGHETSAATAAWLMIWCQQQPEVWKKLHDESVASIQEVGHYDALTQQDQPYVTACLNESQRITPSAPGYIRWLKEDTQIGKWLIPGGTAVLPNIYATHRRKDIYGEDALEFKPERWIQKDGTQKTFAPHEFMPFGGGRRACVGMSQAKQQIRIILSELARRCEFTSEFQGTNTLPVSRLIGGQVEPKEGVPITLSEVRPFAYGFPASTEGKEKQQAASA